MTNIIYKSMLFVSFLIVTMACNDPDTNPLIPEEEFTRVGLVDVYELVTPTNGIINMNADPDEGVIIINLDNTTNDVDSYTLQGDFFTDPQGNNLEMEVDILTITEFPATISLTLEEVAAAFGKDVADLSPGNLVKIHGASVSNGILVDFYTMGSGFFDPDAQITGFDAPYKLRNMLFIPL